MSLKGQLYKSIRALPECIAGGCIDLDSKQLLAMLSIGSESKELFKKLVGISEDLFQGENVQLIEHFFNKARGVPENKQHLFKEMVILNDELIHFFFRGTINDEHIITFVIHNNANMGISLTKARLESLKVEQSINE